MSSNVIIISIHPHHVAKILSGEKLYEYRKKIPIDIRYIIVYATAPVKRIVAIVEVEEVIKGSPYILWQKTKQNAGISFNFFQKYFENHEDGYAIKFKRVVKLKYALSLEILGHKHAPQSYIYIDKTIEEIRKILI